MGLVQLGMRALECEACIVSSCGVPLRQITFFTSTIGWMLALKNKVHGLGERTTFLEALRHFLANSPYSTNIKRVLTPGKREKLYTAGVISRGFAGF